MSNNNKEIQLFIIHRIIPPFSRGRASYFSEPKLYPQSHNSAFCEFHTPQIGHNFDAITLFLIYTPNGSRLSRLAGCAHIGSVYNKHQRRH